MRTWAELAKRVAPRNRVFYTDGAGRVGLRVGEWIRWFAFDHNAGVYRETGSTLTPGPGVTKVYAPQTVGKVEDPSALERRAV